MFTPPPVSPRFERVRQIGRMLFALAAGAGFAYLAWEPPPEKSSKVGNAAVTDDHPTAAQQRDVKEDAALLPTLNAGSGIGQPTDWQRARTHTGDSASTPPGVDVELSAMPEMGDTPLARRAVEEGPDDSVVPHSRSPP